MAAECATGVFTNCAGNLAAEHASPYVSYFFRFGKIVEEFKNRRKELELKKDRVKNDVDEAVRQTEEIEKDVQNWLIRAEKELEETQSLEAEIERNKCFNWCPSWGWRCCLSRKMAKKTISINKLLDSSNFPRMGYRAPLQGIEFLPSKDFMPNESSKFTFNEIIKVLNTDGVNMIGLYGMPGVGKTTLAKEVGKHAKAQKLFDNVLMVTMSQTPNISNIQDKIAALLGLKFQTSMEDLRAEELHGRLKAVKKILIIIDDVWRDFELQDIGIPFGVEHKGCKILLTTRGADVCDRMKCREKFQLQILSEDEAWDLFKDNAGLKDVSSTLNDVAKEVARECKGLPLAIVVIAKALNGADLDEWKAANQRLKDSRHLDNEDVCEGLYNRLKLSYDHLKGDNIRLCFLLCSLFPEDFQIGLGWLIMFGIGYGLFSNVRPMQYFRTEICAALRKLQKSGLLLKVDVREGAYDNDVREGAYDNEIYVSMHDVVRDFAHWITLREENIFMVKEGLTEWPISQSFGCHTAISFWDCNINIFPEKLEFPKLKILIFTGWTLVKVPVAFVKGMKALQVLHMRNVIFSLEVLKFIANLRTLCFEDCELESISSLRNMENLEILAFSDTNIYELPKELVALHELKSLHFSHSGSKQINFPPNLLSRLTSLQELHVTCENNVNLLELNSLSRLTALSLRVSTAQCFPENFVFPKLQSYIIAANENLQFMQGLKLRTLNIGSFSYSLSAFKELFCNVEKLNLENVKGHKNIVPNVDPKGLNGLTSLHLGDWDDMECLMDTAGEKGPTTAFSNLEKLRMMAMTCLKELCHGPPPISFLQKLNDVTIFYCKQLKVVFEMDGLLEKGEISQTPLFSNLTSLSLDSLPELESIWKLQSAHQYHASLQSLKVVNIWKCGELKSTFPPYLAQSLLHLQQLEISECDRLEQVFDFFQEMSEFQVQPLSNLTSLELVSLPELKWIWKGPTHLVKLQSLKTMSIQKCLKLAYLFPTPLAHSLLHLQQLSVQLCEGLEQIFNFSQEMVELEVRPLSDLTYLKLYALPELKWIWKGPTHLVKLQSLKTMRIEKCSKLVYLFPTPLAQSLVHLEELKISHCDSMEHIIFGEAENEDEIVSNKDGCPLCWPKLRTLKIINCERLKYVFPITLAQGLPYLESIQITDCSQLEHVFDVTKDKDGRPPQDIVLQRLQILRLKNLEKLNSFCSENSVMSLSLKEIEVSNCLQLTDRGIKTLQAYLKDVSLYGFKELLCNAKNLTADEIIYPKNLIPNVDPEGLNELTFLALNHGEELECLIDTTDQGHVSTVPLLSNLTSLELESLPELKWIWKGPSHYVCLQSLKVAEISRCNRLKYLFSPSLAQSLVMLEQLEIECCDELEHVATELESDDNIESHGGLVHPPLLPKLTSLGISYCPRLEYVFHIPLAQVVPQLTLVSITNCPQLKHVFNVAKEKNGVDHAIALPHLQHLELENLINLSSFCSANYPIVSPFLEELILVVCPQLENFIIQQAIHKQLQPKELRFSELRQDSVCDTINWEKIFQIQSGYLFSRIEILNLEGIHQLQGPIQVASLCHLKDLMVSNCNRLKSLFSSMLARNLLQLQFLHIKCCGELEEIIETDQTSIASSSHSHLQPPSFPSLQSISIFGCSNLKSLFPISVTRSLSNLQHMDIERASKLEQVFGYQGELNIEDDQKGIVLPKLQELNLSELSGLKSFSPMGYHFRFPILYSFHLTKSPQLTTGVSMDSKHPVPAITEEPQQVQNNTTEGFTTIEEIVDNQSTCNDISWVGLPDGMPLYMTVGKTRITVQEEVKNSGETC
ncbi:disease resistance protein At4g27190-like [Durio zibethinus]|uniref:Disease resistance protein At4g27190-like n=1 Tax=Durio zibethinus TaxID=66656 RepID=A0A6P5Y5G1_DURZI|nr:disease resistance protein At4g27190-like [Durio zibethinus]